MCSTSFAANGIHQSIQSFSFNFLENPDSISGPVTVLGNSVTNEIYLGILKCAIFPLQKIFTSSSSNEHPGFSFIQAQSSSPNRSSETPNALIILSVI